jgi:hypothetical protein
VAAHAGIAACFRNLGRCTTTINLGVKALRCILGSLKHINRAVVQVFAFPAARALQDVVD